jgi:hypothetical protein
MRAYNFKLLEMMAQYLILLIYFVFFGSEYILFFKFSFLNFCIANYQNYLKKKKLIRDTLKLISKINKLHRLFNKVF